MSSTLLKEVRALSPSKKKRQEREKEGKEVREERKEGRNLKIKENRNLSERNNF